MCTIQSVLKIVLGSCLLVLAVSPSWAQDSAQPEESESREKLDPDFYVVPEGDPEGDDVDALLEFIEKIRTYRPADSEGYFAHRRSAPRAILSAAGRILELEKDEASEAHQLAMRIILSDRAQRIGRVPEQEQQTLFDEIKQHFDGKTLEPNDLQIAMKVANGLENSQNTRLAMEAYHFFGSQASKSKDPRLASYGTMLLGAARRLGLVGNEMSVLGTTVDGKPFDLESLRGKVVLVDFWATWCGPCVAEYPNVLALYEKYHTRGFEVVGISLDSDRDALTNYLEEKHVPWPTLHEKDGGRPPSATQYGVIGIPTMILIDPQFKVVSLKARGPQLAKLLQEFLGAPDAEVGDAE